LSKVMACLSRNFLSFQHHECFIRTGNTLLAFG
jgi:hypothetical protein